jgi:hypothetical protein
VLRYAFVEMMDDLALSLIVGIVLSGVIAAAIPAELFQSPLARGFPGLLLMLAIGIPIYVCAAGSTPIAAMLLMKGMSPGAALVFLFASPATNLGSLVVLTRHLGRRVVLLQVAALALVTLALGWTVDLVWTTFGFETRAASLAAAEVGPGWFEVGTAAVLGVFLLLSILRTRGASTALGIPSEQPQPAAH